MNYQGFQNLYQHLKGEDQKLFESFEKVSTYLQQIISSLNNNSTPNLQIAYATGALVLAPSPGVNIPGAYLILPKSGFYLITGCFDMVLSGAGDIGQSLVGELRLNNVLQTATAVFQAQAVQSRVTVMQQWKIEAGSDNVQARLGGYKTGGGGASFINTVHTSITAVS